MKRIAGATAIALLTASCNGGATTTSTIDVLAASSLTDVLTELGRDFERDHAGTRVRFSFAGSSTLAQQLVEGGARADVFASASAETMQRVADARLLVEPAQVLARNRLALVVRPDEPTIGSIEDALRPGVKLAICSPAVPCGATARGLLNDLGLTAHPVTEEQDVRMVLSKVVLREVDCGLVYVTDARAAGDEVRVVALPERPSGITSYPIGLLKGDDQELARELVALLTGATGQRVLADAGFLPPA